MNLNLTELVMIVDRSGSMSHLLASTVSSFKEFCKKHTETDGSVNLTLYTFNDSVTQNLFGVDLKTETSLTDDTALYEWFTASGLTALRDAIGTACKDVGKRLADTTEAERPSKVLVVIITDGFENKSKIYSQQDIQSIIQTQKQVYNWEFVFVGANQDSIVQAKAYSIDHALNFTASERGMIGTMSALASSSTRYRSGEAYRVTAEEQDLARGL